MQEYWEQVWSKQFVNPMWFYSEALTLLEQGQSQGDQIRRSWGRLFLAFHHLRYGNPSIAEEELTATRNFFEEKSVRLGIQRARLGLSFLFDFQSSEESDPYMEPESLDSTMDRVLVYDSLARRFERQGSLEKCFEHYYMALEILENQEFPELRLQIHNNLGLCLARIGNQKEAAAFLAKALVMETHHPLPHLKAALLLNLAQCQLKMEDVLQARYLAEESLEYLDQSEPWLLGRVYGTAAYVLSLTGAGDKAWHLAHKAQVLVAGNTKPRPMDQLLILAAQIHHRIQEARFEEALSLLPLAKPLLNEAVDDDLRIHFIEWEAQIRAWEGNFHSAYALQTQVSQLYRHRTDQSDAQFFQSTQARLSVEKLRFLAMRDHLTGLWNRRYLEETYTSYVKLAARAQAPLVVGLLDLDFFKNVNDTFGHLIGDEILKAFAQEIRSQFRESDLTVRWGGEEFVIVLANCRSEQAEQKLDLLRKRFSDRGFDFHGAQIAGVTFSAGIVESPSPAPVLNVLLEAADRALYGAKENGRNQTVRGEVLTDPARLQA